MANKMKPTEHPADLPKTEVKIVDAPVETVETPETVEVVEQVEATETVEKKAVSSGVADAVADIQTVGETQAKANEKVANTKKKAETKKTILLTLTEDKKDAYKKLFGAQGFSLLQGIRMCLSFVANNVERGNLTLDESGIEFNKIKKL